LPLTKEQSELESRLNEQESKRFETIRIDQLDSKFEKLREEMANFEQTLDDDRDSVDRQRIELRLSELQNKIETLESEIAVLQLSVKKCCTNETFVRELVTSHLEKWLNVDSGRWNDSTLLLRNDLEATLKKVGDELLNDITSATSQRLKSIAESEAEKTVQLILADVVAKIGSKNLTR